MDITEIVKTPEGAFALFIFAFGGCLVGGMILTALSSQSFRNFLSEIFFGGIKCKSCKRRPKKWIQWHQKKDETTYNGWEWCPFCNTKRYEGFSDRVF